MRLTVIKDETVLQGETVGHGETVRQGETVLQVEIVRRTLSKCVRCACGCDRKSAHTNTH